MMSKKTYLTQNEQKKKKHRNKNKRIIKAKKINKTEES